MYNTKFNNKHYCIGLVTFDIGIALLIIGAIVGAPVLLGVAGGFTIFGLGCFVYGKYKENV